VSNADGGIARQTDCVQRTAAAVAAVSAGVNDRVPNSQLTIGVASTIRPNVAGTLTVNIIASPREMCAPMPAVCRRSRGATPQAARRCRSTRRRGRSAAYISRNHRSATRRRPGPWLVARTVLTKRFTCVRQGRWSRAHEQQHAAQCGIRAVRTPGPPESLAPRRGPLNRDLPESAASAASAIAMIGGHPRRGISGTSTNVPTIVATLNIAGATARARNCDAASSACHGAAATAIMVRNGSVRASAAR